MTAYRRAVRLATRPPRASRLAGPAMLLGASFALSRVLGLLRNVAIAYVFGNSPAVQAYVAAFRIPDIMFMLISGGALASAFVPNFAGLLEQGEEEEAWEVASTVLNSVFVLLAMLAVIAFVFAPQLMDVQVHGYSPSQRAVTVNLTRIMLIQPIWLGVAAVMSAILQSTNRFLPTAIAPLLYNVAIIAGAVFGLAYGISALAWAVVAGAVAQVLLQLPSLWPDAERRYRLTIDWASSNGHEILRLLGPRVIGLAAFQAMLSITIFLASGLPSGMVGAIYFAWSLIMFPVGALGTAAATAIFPTLSRYSVRDDLDAVRSTVNRTLRLIIFLALPAAVGLIMLRDPIVRLLYAHGSVWNAQATNWTAFALLFYAIAIAPLSLIEVLARVFYARKDTLTPVRIAIVAVAIDAALSILLVHLLPRTSGQGGLALATAIASTVQAFWLTASLNRELVSIGPPALLAALRDAALASLVMALVLYLSLGPLGSLFGQYGLGALAVVVFEVALGAASFVAASYVVGTPELWEVRSFLARAR